MEGSTFSDESPQQLPQMGRSNADPEAAHRRLTFLAEISTVLSAATDYLSVLDNLARCIVPYLADWCVIDMLGDDGWVHRLALTHRDPHKHGLLAELKKRYPRLHLDAEHTLLRVLRLQRSWLRPELPETQGRLEARDERHWQILQGLGYVSEMVVPLLARGRILGTITFVRGPEARRYGADDLALAEDLARRWAIVVDNARLYQQAREAEAQLRRQLDITNTVMRCLGEGLYTIDPQGRLTFLNPAAERLLGWTEGDLLGQPMHAVIRGGHPEGQPVPATECRILEVLRSHGTLQGEEVFTRRDGTMFPVVFTSSPIITAGEVVGAVVAFQDFTAHKRAEEALKASLREKEVLLKEIHHRVKNNLQIISSLLNLQAGHSEDPLLQAMLEDSQHRIQSVALIHEHLYQASDLARIDFGSYVHNLANQLFHSYQHLASHVTLSTDMADVSLGIDQAIPCGLLVSELVTNSFKHAFPDGRSGKVSITLRMAADRATLVVHDTGIGIPEDLDIHATDSLGLQLVWALSEQLGGSLTLERHEGTLFRLTFPASSEGQR
jgi:PAS domain S-box-containing protein